MHDLCVFDFFVQKSFLTQNFFFAVINLTTRVPLYTCLVEICNKFIHSAESKNENPSKVSPFPILGGQPLLYNILFAP